MAKPAVDTWQDRPSGIPASVPPPSVPLSFLAAAGLGLVACGAAWIWAAGYATQDPTSDPVVAAVHFGVLATLAMGILGATHQFTPVITTRPLRSVRLARATFALWLVTAWMLPLAIATEQLALTEVSGAVAGLAVVLLAINLAKPLSVLGKGAPVNALRLGVLGALLTGLLGAAFVGDRQTSWFELSGHTDLAMGVLGLFCWLGATYVGVAEKLWPMFMLAHVPGQHRAGRLAAWSVPTGGALLAAGLGWGIVGLAVAGAPLLSLGLVAHLVSLSLHVRYRRRKRDLHLTFVVTSASWLPVAAGLAIASLATLPHHYNTGVALAAGASVAVGGWLLEALVGHSHKVVPFIVWSFLRSKGVSRGPKGKPLMFADLYNPFWAGVTYGTLTTGIALLCIGLGGVWPYVTTAGGSFLAIAGIVVVANLSLTPMLMYFRAGNVAPGRTSPGGPMGDARRGAGHQ
ncbi:MAG: hypothetical protein ACRDVP_06795 [Acidimicrobiales bacterium]